MTKQERKVLRQPFIDILFKNNKFNLVMSCVASFLQALAFLAISWSLKEVSDLIAGSSQFDLPMILIVEGAAIAAMFLAWFLDWRFYAEFTAKAMKQYRDYVFEKLLSKGIQTFSNENTSLYLSALSNDANIIERDFIEKIQGLVQTSVTFVGAVVMMVIYSPLLMAVALGLSLLPIMVSVVLGNKAAVAEKGVSDKKEGYTSMIKDALTGFAVIKSFKAEESISRVHATVNEEVNYAAKKRAKITIHIGYSSGLAGGALQIGVFLIACVFAINGIGNVTAGTAIVFVQLLNYVLQPIQVFPAFYAGAKSSYSLIDKLAEALHNNVDDSGEQIPAELTQGISVANLSYSYAEDKPILKGVDMDFQADGCYALVGASGSGKSTLLNLLMASSRDYQGTITYDGKELRNIATSSLYNVVSIIQQNVFVFNSTIRDNITMFSEFPEEEIARAIRLSGLEKLIQERGADYLCGENGSGLSGGERQRISIARALLRKTPALFVDEATASLDAETSFEVLDAILKLENHTRIIVTHDLDENILKRCSGLFVLRNGVVEERGTFDSLMQQKGYFYSLFTVSQKE